MWSQRLLKIKSAFVLRLLAAASALLMLKYMLTGGASSERHKLCVLVPFRDRFEELLEFVPNISQFLANQGIYDPKILVLNQEDDFRFNRASLLNVGFLESQKSPDPCDYVALHDVDLVPKNPKIKYEFPTSGPLHLTAPGLHPKYDYPNFIGGILLLTSHHFKMLNGMSNQYWGWGLEDDEFQARIKDAQLVVKRPDVAEIGTGRETFTHNHHGRKRPRDNVKCHSQWEKTRLRDRETGLHSVKYTLNSKKRIQIEGYSVTILNINLVCDKSRTPWCDCSNAKPEKRKAYKWSEDVIVPKLPKRPKKSQ